MLQTPFAHPIAPTAVSRQQSQVSLGFAGWPRSFVKRTTYGQLLRRMTELDSTSYAVVVPEKLIQAASRVPEAVRARLRIRLFGIDMNASWANTDRPAPRNSPRCSSGALEHAPDAGADVHLQRGEDEVVPSMQVEVCAVQVSQYLWLDSGFVQFVDTEPWPHDPISDEALGQS